MLISNKMDFRTRKIIKDRERHNMLIKGPIHQEDITIQNVFTSSNRASKYMKQTLREKGEKVESKIIVGGSTVFIY